MMNARAELDRERRLLIRLAQAAMAQGRAVGWCPARTGRWQLNGAWHALTRHRAIGRFERDNDAAIKSCLQQGFAQIVRRQKPIVLYAPARCLPCSRAPLRWQLRFQAVQRAERLLGVVCRLQLCAGWRASMARGAVVPWFLPLRPAGDEASEPAPWQLLLPALRESVHPADRTQMQSALGEALARGNSFAVKCRLRLPHGDYHWHRIVGRPERDGLGRVTGFVGGSQDRQQHSDACRLRRTFLRQASHELNTPLTSLTLNLQLAVARSLKASASEGSDNGPGHGQSDSGLEPLLHRALAQARRLSATVDNLLDVQCLLTGELPLHRHPIDLRKPLHETLELLQATLLQAGCRVTLDVPEALPGRFDARRMQQVFFHLLSNVAKFAPGSHLLVTGTHAGSDVRLVLQDDGPGIAKDAARAIFQLFGRGNTGRSSSGLGVGLYLCRRIVRAHGGQLMLRAAQGQGARFEMSLPSHGGRVEPSAADACAAPASEAADDAAKTPAQTLAKLPSPNLAEGATTRARSLR